MSRCDLSFSSLGIVRPPIDSLIAPVELPFTGERENESREVDGQRRQILHGHRNIHCTAE